MKYSIFKTVALLIVSAFPFVGMASVQAATASQAVTAISDDTDIALSQVDMASTRGGMATESLISTQSLAATTSGNTLDVGGNLTNGDINVGNNFGSIGSYVMNTGNNSTINSAVSLNIQIMPSP